MERVLSLGRSRSLGLGFPFASSLPDPPATCTGDGGDEFRWSTEVSKRRAMAAPRPRRLSASPNDTTAGIDRLAPSSPATGKKKKPGRTRRTLTALALLDASTGRHHGRTTPDAPGYGEAEEAAPPAPGYAPAQPNLVQYQADRRAANTGSAGADNQDTSGKPIRTLQIPTTADHPKKQREDRSVLTDEMSTRRDRLEPSSDRGTAAADDVSALSMGTAGREFWGWDTDGRAKSGAFGLGRKKGKGSGGSRIKKNYGRGGRGKAATGSTSTPNSTNKAAPPMMTMLGAISECNEVKGEQVQAQGVNEVAAWSAAVMASTPPITNRKKADVPAATINDPPRAKKQEGAEQLISSSAASSSRSRSPRCRKSSGTPSPTRPFPQSRVSAHSSGELLCLTDRAFGADYNYTENYGPKKVVPTVDMLFYLVSNSKLGNPTNRQKPAAQAKEEMHDDVTMLQTNSKGALGRSTSMTPPKLTRYSEAIGSFDQSSDVVTAQKARDGKSPLYVVASYDSKDNSLLQSRLSFPPAGQGMVNEGIVGLKGCGTHISTATKPPSSGDDYIDAYKEMVDKYNNTMSARGINSGSPARSTKSAATAATAALSPETTPTNTPTRSSLRSVGTGSSSTGDKKGKSTSSSASPKVGLKKLVRMPSLKKARSMGRSASFRAMFSANKPAQDVDEPKNSSSKETEKESEGDLYLAPVDIDHEELARKQEAINRRRNFFTKVDTLEQTDTASYESLEDDDYTEDFNVAREIMDNNIAGQTKVRVNTFDTGFTGYTADTVPSKKDPVATAIADLFCFNPLGAFDLDSVCHPAVVQVTTGKMPATPVSAESSYLAGSNYPEEEDSMPPMPNFGSGEHRGRSVSSNSRSRSMQSAPNIRRRRTRSTSRRRARKNAGDQAQWHKVPTYT